MLFFTHKADRSPRFDPATVPGRVYAPFHRLASLAANGAIPPEQFHHEMSHAVWHILQELGLKPNGVYISEANYVHSFNEDSVFAPNDNSYDTRQTRYNNDSAAIWDELRNRRYQPSSAGVDTELSAIETARLRQQFAETILHSGLLIWLDQQENCLIIPLTNDKSHHLRILLSELPSDESISALTAMLQHYMSGSTDSDDQQIGIYPEYLQAQHTSEQIYQDPVLPDTNVRSQAYAHQRMERTAAHYRKKGYDVEYAIYDLDHFKIFNAGGNYALGDDIIDAQAIVLEHCVGGKKVRLIHLGGDEFGVLFIYKRSGNRKKSSTISSSKLAMERFQEVLRLVSRQGLQERIALTKAEKAHLHHKYTRQGFSDAESDEKIAQIEILAISVQRRIKDKVTLGRIQAVILIADPQTREREFEALISLSKIDQSLSALADTIDKGHLLSADQQKAMTDHRETLKRINKPIQQFTTLKQQIISCCSNDESSALQVDINRAITKAGFADKVELASYLDQLSPVQFINFLIHHRFDTGVSLPDILLPLRLAERDQLTSDQEISELIDRLTDRQIVDFFQEQTDGLGAFLSTLEEIKASPSDQGEKILSKKFGPRVRGLKALTTFTRWTEETNQPRLIQKKVPLLATVPNQYSGSYQISPRTSVQVLYRPQDPHEQLIVTLQHGEGVAKRVGNRYLVSADQLSSISATLISQLQKTGYLELVPGIETNPAYRTTATFQPHLLDFSLALSDELKSREQDIIKILTSLVDPGYVPSCRIEIGDNFLGNVIIVPGHPAPHMVWESKVLGLKTTVGIGHSLQTADKRLALAKLAGRDQVYDHHNIEHGLYFPPADTGHDPLERVSAYPVDSPPAVRALVEQCLVSFRTENYHTSIDPEHVPSIAQINQQTRDFNIRVANAICTNLLTREALTFQVSTKSQNEICIEPVSSVEIRQTIPISINGFTVTLRLPENSELAILVPEIEAQLSLLLYQHTMKARQLVDLSYDTSTGLLNNAGITRVVGARIDILREKIKSAKEANPSISIDDLNALVNANPIMTFFFDGDYFKSINDRLGHSAGDAVIALFSRAMQFVYGSPESDDFINKFVLARRAGDEFMGAGFDLDIEKATGKLEQLRKLIALFSRLEWDDPLFKDEVAPADVTFRYSTPSGEEKVETFTREDILQVIAFNKSLSATDYNQSLHDKIATTPRQNDRSGATPIFKKMVSDPGDIDAETKCVGTSISGALLALTGTDLVHLLLDTPSDVTGDELAKRVLASAGFHADLTKNSKPSTGHTYRGNRTQSLPVRSLEPLPEKPDVVIKSDYRPTLSF